MSHWLVRTAKNVISGPYNKEALCQMILSGELGSQDEVCDSGQYWIFLHEREEVSKQLGINLPKPPKNPDEETTETQTQTQTQTQTDAGVKDEHTPAPMNLTSVETAEEVEAAALAAMEEDDGATQVLGSKARPNGARPVVASPAEPERNGSEGAALPAAEAARSLGLTPAEAAAPKPTPTPAQGPKVVYRPMVLGEIERPSAWRMAIWILVVAAFFLAFWMLRALRR